MRVVHGAWAAGVRMGPAVHRVHATLSMVVSACRLPGSCRRVAPTGPPALSLFSGPSGRGSKEVRGEPSRWLRIVGSASKTRLFESRGPETRTLSLVGPKLVRVVKPSDTAGYANRHPRI